MYDSKTNEFVKHIEQQMGTVQQSALMTMFGELIDDSKYI